MLREDFQIIIVPTYNESTNIALLVRRIRNSAANEPVFFVDDNSPDGTADVIREVQRTDPNIHLMVRPNRGGYASACREAMQEIIADGLAEYLIQSDADLSHPPEALPRMIGLLGDKPVVIGSRYVRGGRTENWDIRRRIFSFGGNLYARLLTGVPVHDMTAGFIGYRAEILRKVDLNSIRSEGYAFLMEMKYILHQQGVPFYEFPITFKERAAGNSKFSLRIMLEGVSFPARVFVQRIAMHPSL
jgi:dolichol-phosphate mannosyltransferase